MSDANPGLEGLQASEFNNFILSLASSVMYHMGEPSPDGSVNPEPNLPLAKHTIDIIVMLQEKTQGNLSGEESRLLSSLLYDLRMRFLKAQRGSEG